MWTGVHPSNSVIHIHTSTLSQILFPDSYPNYRILSRVPILYHRSLLIILYRVVCISSEKAMAPHSSTLAWKIPWTEQPGSHGVTKSRTRLSNFTFTFHFPALEKEMATHSSVLAWRIPGTGEPGGLPSIGSHRVGHD